MLRIYIPLFYIYQTLSEKGMPITIKLMTLLNLKVLDRPLGNLFLQYMNLDRTHSKLMRMVGYSDKMLLSNSLPKTLKSRLVKRIKMSNNH